MDLPVYVYVIIAVVGLVGLVAGFLLAHLSAEGKIRNANKIAAHIVEEAEKAGEAKKREALLEARDQLHADRTRQENEIREWRNELTNLEKKIVKREELLDAKLEQLEKRDQDLKNAQKSVADKERSLDQKNEQLDALLREQQSRLESIAGLTIDQAKDLLLKSLERDLKRDQALLIKRVQDETKELAAKRAREIITSAIQRTATEQVVEATVSVVPINSDDMKGRIIGREGRNIRAFEQITGINLIIDDTPEAVVLSGFDPVRREIARRTLGKLLQDGRIHPGRIEEIYEKTVREVEELMREAGEQTAFEVGLHDLHPDLVKYMGRLKFRTSYAQNVLAHSAEVAVLAAAIAADIGADVNVAKRAGFLHDIGKSIDFEVGGSHALIGADIARRYNESPLVVHAIAAHHEDEEMRTIEAVLVQAADAISAARPGARRESLETYVKRLEQLETLANAIEGVESSYAIQAGRELRIVVEPEEVDDAGAAKIAYDVSRKIEQEMEYPGQIKVTVVREVRSTDYAR
ncbi:ribonuclease Y [bacterium]|nr:ribonuclease Y [bacterium]